VLVVQANAFNRSKIATIVVAVITSNLALGDAPGNVRIGKSESGLPKPSVVNVSQILMLDRAMLTEPVKVISIRLMERVDVGLRLVLGL